jgi:hypothetical protein
MDSMSSAILIVDDEASMGEMLVRGLGEDPSELAPMEEVERRYIARVMQAVGGQQDACGQGPWL